MGRVWEQKYRNSMAENPVLVALNCLTGPLQWMIGQSATRPSF